jgi:hypothetical protein
MMTTAARAIRTHSHGLVDPLAAGVVVGEGAADVVSAAGEGDGEGDGDGDGGAVVTSGVGVGGALVGGALVASAARVGRLGGEIVMPALAAALFAAPAALFTALHPAVKEATARMPATRINKPFRRRLDTTVIFWPAGRRVFTRRG